MEANVENLKNMILELDDITLKPIEANDAHLIFELRSDPQIIKYTGIKKMTEIQEARDFILKRQNDMASGTAYYWCIYERLSKRSLGTVCLWQFNEQDLSCHIGYELLPFAQGKGLMYAASSAVVSYAFKKLNRQILKAEIDSANMRSIRLIERLGFKDVGCDGAYRIYALSKLASEA